MEPTESGIGFLTVSGTPRITPDFDGMTCDEVRSSCKTLWANNLYLIDKNYSMKFVVIHNEQVHKELATKYEDAKDKLVKQNLIIAQTEELKEQNLTLHDLCDQLKSYNVQLNDENENLKRTLHEYACRIALLEAQVQTLLSRDAPITIREAMRMLERWICYEASGSKTRFMKKYYNFDKINTTGDPAVRSDLSSVLAKLKLTSEHTDTLDYVKDCPEQARGWDDC